MEIGVVGLGRMGAAIATRLMRDGHAVVAHDLDADAVADIEAAGAVGARSLRELVERLAAPRAIWLMLPAGAPTEGVVSELGALLAPDDTLIDGGNTHYVDDMRRIEELAKFGIHYADCGTSGGTWGLERGFCLMVGADEQTFARLEPAFASLAPGPDEGNRTPGRAGEPSPAEKGYLRCGPPGAGHFVKMIHNGIEYGMMASLAEGMNILSQADVGKRPRQADAETTPLSDPSLYSFDIDVPAVAEVWRHGSVIGSWLLDLAASVLARDPELANFQGVVSDSGEGRWTAVAAIEEGVPAPVITAALFSRFASRGEDDLANRLLSAMRKEFGGHQERT